MVYGKINNVVTMGEVNYSLQCLCYDYSSHTVKCMHTCMTVEGVGEGGAWSHWLQVAAVLIWKAFLGLDLATIQQLPMSHKLI